MKTCSEDCVPVCDFCVHMQETKFCAPAEGTAPYLLTGMGYCQKHETVMPLHGKCEDFQCMNVSGEDIEGDSVIITL